MCGIAGVYAYHYAANPESLLLQMQGSPASFRPITRANTA